MLTMARQATCRAGVVPEPAALLVFEWCRKQWWKITSVVVTTLTDCGKSRGEIQLNWAEFTQHLRCLFSILHPSPKYYRAKSQTSPGWMGSLPSPTTQVVTQCHPAAHTHQPTMILRSPAPLSLSEAFLAAVHQCQIPCLHLPITDWLPTSCSSSSLFAVMEE